jgi:NitT/TauT family transport system ATP-binding protein
MAKDAVTTTKGTTRIICSMLGISKTVEKKPILKDISLSYYYGAKIGVLGLNGSGKSTLLRIMAGLIQPSVGQLCSHDNPMRGAKPNPAVVFQSFALLPWLTVQETVELGLAARHGARAERRDRTLRPIDIVGLDGFESVYP